MRFFAARSAESRLQLHDATAAKAQSAASRQVLIPRGWLTRSGKLRTPLQGGKHNARRAVAIPVLGPGRGQEASTCGRKGDPDPGFGVEIGSRMQNLRDKLLKAGLVSADQAKQSEARQKAEGTNQ